MMVSMILMRMMMVSMILMRIMMAYLRTWHTIVMATSNIDGTGFILNYILFSSGLLWYSIVGAMIFDDSGDRNSVVGPDDDQDHHDEVTVMPWSAIHLYDCCHDHDDRDKSDNHDELRLPWCRCQPSTCLPPQRPLHGSRPLDRMRSKPGLHNHQSPW